MVTVPAVAALVIALLLGLLWAAQRRFIYLPGRDVPSVDGLLPGAESIRFTTEDGLELAGWFVPGSGDVSVLVANGNAGTRADRASLARALVEQGMSVLLFDYRGYGGNPGSPSQEGLLADARAALGYLEERPGTDPSRLIFFGESLGSAVVARLAVEQPPAGVVLRSPFASLAEVASVHYPGIPARLLLKDRFEVVDVVARLEVPLLVVAGSDDSIVPPVQSRRVAEAARDGRLVMIDGADHNDLELAAGPELVGAVVVFVEEVIP
ncbi:MAG: alpha/beta hydrolase [Acidimicrobiia bacterium]